MISNRSVPTDTVLPHIKYRNLQQAIPWLGKAFGFVELYRYGSPLSGAQVRAGNAFIMLKQAGPGYATPQELGFGTQSLTIFIEEIESHYTRARSAGSPFSRICAKRCTANCNTPLWISRAITGCSRATPGI